MKSYSKKATVTQEHREEAERLRALWEAADHESQAVFGERYEIGNQSAVGQFLRGESALSLKAAAGFARGLSCSIVAFSPRLAAQAAQLSAERIGTPSPLESSTDNEPEIHDAIYIPLLANSGSMGAGTDQSHEDVVIGRLTLSPTWVEKRLRPLSDRRNLRFIHGYGDSMHPTFEDGDVLLVDSGINAVNVDGVYVLEAQHRLFIKRVRQRLDGAFEISSDNPTVKTVDILDGSHSVCVLGKVVWIWNGKKI